MKKLILLTIIAITFPIFSTLADADTLTVNSRSGFYIDGTYSTKGYILAGEFDVTLDGFESAAFCVELNIPIEIGSSYLASILPISSPSLYNTALLMDNYSTGLGFSNYASWGYSKDEADAALQIAIWKTLYDVNFYNDPYHNNSKDPGDGPSTNDTSLDGLYEEDAWRLAAIYLTNLNSLKFSNDYAYFVAQLSQDTANIQDLLVAQAIPEPATLLLFGFGLLGLGAMGRRKE